MYLSNIWLSLINLVNSLFATIGCLTYDSTENDTEANYMEVDEVDLMSSLLFVQRFRVPFVFEECRHFPTTQRYLHLR